MMYVKTAILGCEKIKGVCEMNVRFMDLRIEEKEAEVLMEAIRRVFNHGFFINGEELGMFEKYICEYHNRAYASGVCSGTGALYYALRALGIGDGDEVITTSLSWIATANAICSAGATPVFADINDDLNINANGIEKLITPKTKAILPVHYAGRVCEIEKILDIAKSYDLLVVEDASQAIGAKRNGILAGSFGDVACFSLNPMKVLGALGEAGIILCDHKAIKDKIDILRYNGTINKEICIEISGNGRMDTLQAAILLERLKTFENIIQKRKVIAYRYNEALKDIVGVPIEKDGEINSWYSYTILTDKRNALREYLEQNGIETKIQHPILMPMQPAYSKYVTKNIQNAKKVVEKILCIPCHEKLTQQEQEYVIQTIRRFYE